jgi:hypothetical protein
MPVIIWGPPGSGKTRNGKKLAEFYKCDFVVAEWDGSYRSRPNGLYLTQRRHPNAIHIKDALKAAGIEP